ncbi:MAG: DUF5104 domain-containing protein [Oscillospiraceae bacterium]|nr:DUF5104 domain-containing protein [Oscillospiraceae bacterium]
MNKIIAGILAFLLWLFPWSNSLFGLHAQLSFDRDAVMDKIATCITDRNVETLESMMRPWFKANVSDLRDQLTQFYDAIDGDIQSIIKGAEGSSNDGGIYSEEMRFSVATSKGISYHLVIMYDVSNTKNRTEVGISAIRLATGQIGDPDRQIHFILNTPEWR